MRMPAAWMPAAFVLAAAAGVIGVNAGVLLSGAALAFAQSAGETDAGAPPQDVTAGETSGAGVVYGNPGEVPLPADKFAGMREALVWSHFPNPVRASKDPDQPGTYFWKHNSAVISETEDVTIEEAGSFIYYNDRWNLRVAFTPEQFAELFSCPDAVMKAGQPYTWNDNWRTDARLYGGWACYYAIGTTADGERVYGAGPIETAGEFYHPEVDWIVDLDSSRAGWTGRAEYNDFSIDGTLAIVSGEVVTKGFDVLRGEIVFDMSTVASDVDGVAAHLMNADFFEADTYPYAVFRLAEPVALNAKGGAAVGALTLKGTTKTIAVTFDKLFLWDDEGRTDRMVASGETTFDRTDFGVTFGSVKFFPDAGEHAVADDVVFRFDLRLDRIGGGGGQDDAVPGDAADGGAGD